MMRWSSLTPPAMTCGRCGGPVNLVWHHAPLKENDVAGTLKIPPGVWDKDVLVVCPCCSFASCPHREGGLSEAEAHGVT